MNIAEQEEVIKNIESDVKENMENKKWTYLKRKN